MGYRYVFLLMSVNRVTGNELVIKPIVRTKGS